MSKPNLLALTLAGSIATLPTHAAPDRDDVTPGSLTTTTASSGLAVVPAHFDLGALPPKTAVERSVWLVNTSWQPLTVRAVKPSCGCTTVLDFEPVTLAPGAARAVTFSVKTPKKDGVEKRVRLVFEPEWGEPVTVTTTIAADAEAEPPAASAAADGLLFLPETSDLGLVKDGAAIETSAWVINAGATAARVSDVKAGCGCTEIVGFAPAAIEPASALRVRLRVTPKAKQRREKTVTITARLDDAAPLKTSVRMRIEKTVASATPDGDLE